MLRCLSLIGPGHHDISGLQASQQTSDWLLRKLLLHMLDQPQLAVSLLLHNEKSIFLLWFQLLSSGHRHQLQRVQIHSNFPVTVPCHLDIYSSKTRSLFPSPLFTSLTSRRLGNASSSRPAVRPSQWRSLPWTVSFMSACLRLAVLS